MNTMAKGTIAGLAGIALLLGGAGTFALWNDELAPWDAGTVQTGALQFVGHSGAWRDVTNDTEIDPTADHMVPGDVFRYEGTITLLAYGKNLDAELTIEGADDDLTLPEGLSFELTDENDNELDLSNAIDLDDPDEQTVAFRATLTFDSKTSGTTSQEEEVDLDGLTFKLRQLDPSST